VSFRDSMDRAITALIILGLVFFSIGLISWIANLLQRYNLSWELQLAAIGLVLILLASTAAKLFSRD